MDRDDYKELTDFLGTKFERIDQRFEQIDQRFERVEGEIRQVGVLVEENTRRIQVLSEVIRTVEQRLDRFQDEVSGEFVAVRGEMKVGFGAVHERVDRVEETLGETRAEMAEGFRSVDSRFDGLDGRVERLEDPRNTPGPVRGR